MQVDDGGESEVRVAYFHTDHLGTLAASAMSNESGTLVVGSVTRYLPYGGCRTAPSANLTDHGFTGHKHNDDLGLVYMRARYYVPGLGRFASADTIVPDPGNPQSLNRYSYVLNSPLLFIDPTGHDCANPTNPGEATHCQFAEQRALASTVRVILIGYEYNLMEEADGTFVKIRTGPDLYSEGLGTVIESNQLFTHDHHRFLLDEGVELTGIQLMDAKGNLLASPTWLNYNVSGARAGILTFDRSEVDFGSEVAHLGSPQALARGDELAQVVLHGGKNPDVQWVQFREWNQRDRSNLSFETTGKLLEGDSGGGNFHGGSLVGCNWKKDPSRVAIVPLSVAEQE